MAKENNLIKNIHAVSNWEVYSMTDADFENPRNVGTISTEDENGKYSSIEFKSIDFRTGIVESTTGELYRISDAGTLQDMSESFGMSINIEDFYNPKMKETTYTKANTPTIEIVEDNLTVVAGESEKDYKIIGMYHSFDKDILQNILKERTDAIEAEIATLSDSPEDIAIREMKNAELTRARESIEEFGDVSLSLYKGTTLSFVVEGEKGIEILTFKDVTYDSFKDMTGFSSVDSKNPDIELIRSVEEMSKEISSENSSEVYKTSSHSPFLTLSNIYIQEGYLYGYCNGEPLEGEPLSEVEATISKRGLELTVGGEKMLVLSSDDEFARTTHDMFAEICNEKELTMLSDQQLTESSQSRIIEQMDSLKISPIYRWDKNGTSPEILYIVETGDSLKTQKLTREELEQSVYASERDGLIAARIGDATQILYKDKSSLSQTTEIGTLELDKNGRASMLLENGTVYPSFIDCKNNIAIHNGTVYQTTGTIYGVDGYEIDSPIISGRNDVAELLEQKVSTYEKQNDRVINNWDIISKDGTFYLASVTQDKEDVNVKIEQEIKSIAMSSDGTLKARFEKGFRVLGTPAEVASEGSVYRINNTPVPMKDVIEMSNNAESAGISTVIKQMNDKLKEEASTKTDIVNHQELIRKIPDKWFVVIDEQIYYKKDNTLYGENGSKLNFDEQRTNIDMAFTVSQSEHANLIHNIHERDDISIRVEGHNGRDISIVVTDLSAQAEQGEKYEAEKHDIKAMHINDEKTFAVDNDVAREELAKETESPVME